MKRQIRIAEKKLAIVAAEFGNKSADVRVLSRRLNREFKSMKVRFKTKQVNEFFGYAIDGEFNRYTDMEYGEGRYNLTFYYDPKHPIIGVKSALTDIILILVHEFRHSWQDRNRTYHTHELVPPFNYSNKHVQKQVRYYGCPSELDAHAYDAAYARHHGLDWKWAIKRYKKYLGKHLPHLYRKFLNRFQEHYESMK